MFMCGASLCMCVGFAVHVHVPYRLLHRMTRAVLGARALLYLYRPASRRHLLFAVCCSNWPKRQQTTAVCVAQTLRNIFPPAPPPPPLSLLPALPPALPNLLRLPPSLLLLLLLLRDIIMLMASVACEQVDQGVIIIVMENHGLLFMIAIHLQWELELALLLEVFPMTTLCPSFVCWSISRL